MVRDNRPASRRTMLKKVSTAMVGLSTIALAGCSGNGSGSDDGSGSDGGSDGGGESFELTFATTQPSENISVQTAQEHFIDVIEAETDGRMDGDLRAASLGGTEDNLAALEDGTVDRLHESPTALAQRWHRA